MLFIWQESGGINGVLFLMSSNMCDLNVLATKKKCCLCFTLLLDIRVV